VGRDNQQLEQTAHLVGQVGQIGCTTGIISILIIGLAFGAGRLLDNWLDTGGVFTVLFLVGSFPVTLYVIVRVSLAAARKMQPPASRTGSETKNSEEGHEI
jgi:hypothetical protein